MPEKTGAAINRENKRIRSPVVDLEPANAMRIDGQTGTRAAVEVNRLCGSLFQVSAPETVFRCTFVHTMPVVRHNCAQEYKKGKDNFKPRAASKLLPQRIGRFRNRDHQCHWIDRRRHESRFQVKPLRVF